MAGACGGGSARLDVINKIARIRWRREPTETFRLFFRANANYNSAFVDHRILFVFVLSPLENPVVYSVSCTVRDWLNRWLANFVVYLEMVPTDQQPVNRGITTAFD
jgi:hypothetical protein